MTAHSQTPDAQPTASNRDLVLSDKELQRMEAVCEAATPGPWPYSDDVFGHDGEFSSANVTDGPWDIACCYGGALPPDAGRREQAQADAEFIANARTALPLLLAEVRRLRSLEHRVLAACAGFSSVRVSVIQQAIDGEK